MKNNKLYQMKFKAIYEAYLNKVTRKDKTKEELDLVICWLTGYSPNDLNRILVDDELTLEDFFINIPQLNDKSNLITGVICGVRVEDIKEPIMKQIRMLDKLVDELAKNKKIEKILRV